MRTIKSGERIPGCRPCINHWMISELTHEDVHAQQPWAALDLDLNESSVLSFIIEGGAAFISDFINNGKNRPIDYNKKTYEYGEVNEKEVWQAFKKGHAYYQLGQLAIQPKN